MENTSRITLDCVLPVYNEERDLEPSVNKLRNFLLDNCPYNWTIVIADNASTDSTPDIGNSLASRDSRIGYIRLPQKGRGRALRKAWSDSKADIVAYMDVDLSTDLEHLMPLIEPLAKGKIHVATGSRLLPGSEVIDRSQIREIASRVYNILIHIMFPQRTFADAQCGFKALTRHAVKSIVPQIVDNEWFFDTELLLRSQAAGLGIHQIPVRWVDDPDSTVNILDTAWKDIKGLVRVRFSKTEPISENRPTSQNQSSNHAEFDWLEGLIGYRFNNASILKQALTHRSYLNENPEIQSDNERLEHLGDAVLDLIASEMLFNNYPEMAEGRITSLRAALVKTETLAKLSLNVGIDTALLMGKGEEESGGRMRSANLCAAFEAVTAAIYLDGGLQTTQEVIQPLFESLMDDILSNDLDRDPRSAFQEWSQAALSETPRYKTILAEGPDHDKQFTVQVLVGDRVYGTGVGKRKQLAAKAAAKNALNQTDNLSNDTDSKH
ncbi:MAG: ribonuclease III [Chloroflexota bacterium]